MKTTKYLLTLFLSITSFGVFAQKADINTEKSTIEWLAKKIGGQHEGAIKIKSGSLELKDGNIIAGDFTIDMNAITCTDIENEKHNQKLIKHLKSDDFFGVEKFSTATLKITNSTKFDANKASVTGELTIKGKTESIAFDVVRDGKTYTIKIDVDRSKFDVRYGSTSFFDSLGNKAIDDIFNLNITLFIN